MKRFLLVPFIALLAALSFCQNDPGTGAHLPSQAAADLIRQAAGSDIAFLAAGLVNSSYQSANLASLAQYPTEEIVVLNLKGSAVKQALERSLSLYPQSNTSFLQLSGLTVEFTPGAGAGKRVQQVQVSGSPLDASRTYTVAMPSSLGQGNLGYFKIWDKSKITKTLKATVESVLSGKPYSATSPRWVSHS